MSDLLTLLSWAWTALGYLIVFVLAFGFQLWLLAQAEDYLKGPLGKAWGPALLIAMVTVAGFTAYAVNAVKTYDCPAGYDKQGVYADC